MSKPLGVVTATGVTKRFGSQRVVHSVSLACDVGEVLLILGANGAGKSTLLRILAGLVRPDSGSVGLERGSRIGFASHHTFLYSKLSVRENLRLYSALLNAPVADQDKLLSRMELASVLDTPVNQLSKGTQAKVSLVRALLGKPQLLLLDEPSSNLDERSVRVLLEEVDSQKTRGAAILVTHDVARLKHVATRVVVLEQGAIVADSGSDASGDRLEDVFHRYYEGNR
jgi:heme exporter protein A